MIFSAQQILNYSVQQKETYCDLKVSHPRCVVKIQVREENPILYSNKTTKHKTKFITTTCFGLNYRPSSGCI